MCKSTFYVKRGCSLHFFSSRANCQETTNSSLLKTFKQQSSKMTLAVQAPLHLAMTTSPAVSECCTSYRWPTTVAKNMADMIHQQVRDMLCQSRLVRQSDRVELVRREDIARVDAVLGSGAFSQVSAVTMNDGRRFACKNLKQKLMEQPENFRLAAAELACEAHMLASFDHPHILKIRGWAYNGIASFEDGHHDSFFLLLDQLEETLDQRIDRWRLEEEHAVCALLIANGLASRAPTTGGFPDFWQKLTSSSTGSPDPIISAVKEQQLLLPHFQMLYLEKLRIIAGIASALEYLHERGVIFRDLKPNNIGFLNGQVQLFDFGLSRELPALDTGIPFEMSGKVGTLRYMAPEVALHQPYNVSADVYSWAMVCYEMLSLEKPFDGWTRDMHSNLVCGRGMRPDTINCLGNVSFDMRVLLEHAWSAIPSKRPAVPAIVAQLQFMVEQEVLVMEERQLKEQLSLRLEQQRRIEQLRQHEEVAAVAAAMYIDMQYFPPAHPHPHAHRKHFRSRSCESIETIETTSLSTDSLDF